MRRVPLVGLPSDRKQIGHHPFQAVGEKYLRGVIDGAGCLPLLIPSLQPPLDLRAVLAELDGLLLTGSPSDIEPHHYGNEASYHGNLHDPARDATTLGLIPLAIELRLPVLAVCRGFQEVNVALGGSLHQKVHEVPGFDNHREDLDAPVDSQYAPAHTLRLSPGGLLRRIAGADEVMVNSLHGQGIKDLGRGLVVEATAPDGLIEAVRLDRRATATAMAAHAHPAPAALAHPCASDDADDPFLLAVQWHPEWKVRDNPFYLGIFQAFAAACRERAEQRM